MFCRKKKRLRSEWAQPLFVYSQIRLESELVTNREHKYAVLRSLIAILLEHLSYTKVVTSVEYKTSVLIREAKGNRESKARYTF